MRNKWEKAHWDRRIRYVQLDGLDSKRYEDDPEPTLIATREDHNGRWAYNKISRIDTDEGLRNLVSKRRALQKEERKDDYWDQVFHRVQAHGCNVTGKYISPYTGQLGEYTLAPSKTDYSILLGEDSSLPTVVDDDLLLFYSKRQRRYFFRAVMIARIEELLTVAGRDRLPALPQEQRFPVKKLGQVEIFGITMLFTSKEFYIKTGRSTGHYNHFWQLFYMSETEGTEFIEMK